MENSNVEKVIDSGASAEGSGLARSFSGLEGKCGYVPCGEMLRVVLSCRSATKVAVWMQASGSCTGKADQQFGKGIVDWQLAESEACPAKPVHFGS